MKKMFLNTEKLNKDDKRRLLLNKKYEEENNTLAAPIGAAEGVLTYTKKRLYAIIAVIVALAVLSSSVVIFVVKGASTAEGTKITSVATQTTETNDVITYAVKAGGMSQGSYNVTYDGRTFVYRVKFDGDASEGSHLNTDKKLLEGDIVTFNKKTKDLTWTYNPAHRGGTDVLTVASKNASGDELTLQSKKAYVKGTTYYYFDSNTNNYYFFSIKDDRIGYKAGSTKTINDIETSGANPNYQYQRVLTDPEMIDSSDNPIRLIIDRDNNELSLLGDQLNRKQIYVQATGLENGGVYLIHSSANNTLVGADTSNPQNRHNDSGNRYSFDDCNFSSTQHKYYRFSELSATPETYSGEGLYQLNSAKDKGSEYSSSTLANYIDSGSTEDTFRLTEFYAKSKTISIDYNRTQWTGEHWDTATINGFYLFGYHDEIETSRQNCYSSDKTLGKIFNDSEASTVTLYNLCEGNSEKDKTMNYVTWGIKYLHNADSVWQYDYSKAILYTKYRTAPSDDKLGTHYLRRSAENNYVTPTQEPNATQFDLYKRTSVYTATPLSNNNLDDWYVDKLVSASEKPISISYTETDVADNGLELSKIVTETDNENIFDVTLEAHMDKNKLDRPDTDIEIVLDTSLAMSNKVYSRKYENLKTYSVFEGVSTSNLTHDNLYDDDSTESWIINAMNLIIGGIWQLLTESRQYTHNKYVEDPNAPGTYCYLHQEYKSQAVSEGNAYTNYYRYHFTSSNGDVYSTYDSSAAGNTYNKGFFTFGFSETAGKEDKLPNQLIFYKNGNISDPNPVSVSTIYHVPGYDNGAENEEVSLTKKLQPIADSGRLYTKIGEEYKQVKLYTHTGSEEGMFTYYVMDTGSTTVDNATYKFTTGGKAKLNPGRTTDPYSGEYSVFQGFRHYILTTNDEGQTVYRLDPNENSLLSKALYYKHDEDQTVTGLTAMQEALEEFLLTAHERAVDNDATIHVGLVTYDKSSYIDYALNTIDMGNPVGTNTVDTLITHIYNINLTDKNLGGHNTWAAELGEGMHTAYNQMETLSRAGSNRYTLVFTGGKPIDYRSIWLFTTIDTTRKTDKFDMEIAEDAIQVADDFKNKLQSTVYTVGAYDNASSTMLNGRAWYYAWRDTWPCDGNPGKYAYWGGSWLANLAGYNIDPSDAYATNRMLAYMSSNYSNATTLGVTRRRYAPGDAKSIIDWAAKQLSKTYGYRITHNNQKTDDGYFFGLSPNTLDDENQQSENEPTPDELTETEFKAAMSNILSGIEKATEVAKSKLDSNAWLVDGITPYFDLVDGLEGVTAQIQKPDGTVVTTLSGDNVVYDPDEKTISVKGFNYKDHFYDDASANSEQAQKLVVKFQIQRDSNFIGGNFVPTNQNKSAVYDGQNGNYPGVLVERFDLPHVDLSILDVNDYTKNDSVYYSCEEDLANLVNPVWVDGYRNSYVNIEYHITDGNGVDNTYKINHGETTGTWTTAVGANNANLDQVYPQLFDTTQYSVEVKVTPVYDGTYDDETSDETSTVYVFKPHFDVHNDIVNNAGDKYILTKVPEETWVGHDVNGNKLEGTELETAEGYLDGKMMPNYSYDIRDASGTTTIAIVTAELNDDGDGYDFTITPTGYDNEETGGTPIDTDTDFTVRNVNVTPTTFSYDIEGITEINYYTVSGSGEDATVSLLYSYDTQTGVYYNEDGTPAEDQAAAAQAVQSVAEDNIERVTGIITTDVNRQTENASTNEDVTYMNADDERTNGAFTISLKGYDVVIRNHTIKSATATNDYADKTKEFPLKLTLTKGGNALANEEISYINEEGREDTLTFDQNGQATINLKDGEQVTLKKVKNGAVLNVLSDPDDAYYVLYQAGTNENDLAVVPHTNEAVDITIDKATLIDVTHSIDDIPITGFGDKSINFNPFFILAAILTIGGGAYGGYTYKRKKETELKEFIGNSGE